MAYGTFLPGAGNPNYQRPRTSTGAWDGIDMGSGGAWGQGIARWYQSHPGQTMSTDDRSTLWQDYGSSGGTSPDGSTRWSPQHQAWIKQGPGRVPTRGPSTGVPEKTGYSAPPTYTLFSAGRSGGGAGGSSRQPQAPKWILDLLKQKATGGGGAPELTPYAGGSYTAPERWTQPTGEGFDFDMAGAVGTYRPRFDAAMGQEMADAARRLGAEGGLQGSEYMQSIADANVRRDTGLAEAVYPYAFQADQANWQAGQNAIDRDLSSWGTSGGWQHEGSLADADRGYNAWRDTNSFNLDRWAQEQGINMQQINALLAMMPAFRG